MAKGLNLNFSAQLLVAFVLAYNVWNIFNAKLPILSRATAEEKENVHDVLHPIDAPGGKATTTIFYNLYTKDESDVERVRNITVEQFSFMLPEEHDQVFVTTIGVPQVDLPVPNAEIIQHHPEGGEELTLHELWNYCRSHPYHSTKVVYLHSKGSFHDNKKNTDLRKFITRAALSKECANLPDQCDVCSARMSPIPHPHSSGNMWLARCDYVAKLVDPSFEPEGEKAKLKEIDESGFGWGRFFSEHWIHFHPSVRPCDLYPGSEFTFGRANIPVGDFKKDLKMAPRFDFDTFNILLNFTKPKEGFIVDMFWEFDLFYNQRPDETTWWGWNFYNTTYAKMVQPSVKTWMPWFFKTDMKK